MNDAILLRAVDRQRRRLAELERRLAVEGAACPPDVVHEHEELRLIVTLLEAAQPPPTAQTLVRLAPRAALPQRITWPADGKEMVLVPAGPFILGAAQGYRTQDQPAHEVALPDFYIDRTPVTVAEFMRFVAITDRTPPRLLFPGPRPLDFDQHPITCVSWHDARAYAAWAGKRLPSEAEWEKAASWDSATGAKRRYPWGNQWDKRLCNMLDTGIGHTSPAGVFSPYGDSPCGAADMAGNVFEWTTSLDWNYPYQLGDGRDDLERYGTRVRRGGAYTSEELFMRTTTRQLSPPDGMFIADGFRCAADPPMTTGTTGAPEAES
jgi:formylglycine-generating enzyme required for sulfatase activity